MLGFLSFVLLFPSSRSVFIRDLSLVVVIPECCSRESVFAVLVLFQNDRSPTKFLGDDDFIKKEVIVNLFQDLPLGFFTVLLFNKVILEGFCPESVVFLFLSNNRSWTTTFQDDGNDSRHDR